MKLKRADVAVVIPIYKELDPEERISLNQCSRLLGRAGYHLFLVKPERLDVTDVLKEFPGLRVENFDNHWFESLRSYNKFVLQEEFYSRFSAYKYMLIYQLDAYVFRGGDELLRWCRKGYDYIGAPWMPYKKIYLNVFGRMYLNMVFTLFSKFHDRYHHDFHRNQVGNGGLSLRKVDKFIYLTQKYRSLFDSLLQDDKPFYPEDLMLLYELQNTSDRLKKPSFNRAIRFAFEENPEVALKYTHDRLPFGCHAWTHPSFSNFWSNFI